MTQFLSVSYQGFNCLLMERCILGYYKAFLLFLSNSVYMHVFAKGDQ